MATWRLVPSLLLAALLVCVPVRAQAELIVLGDRTVLDDGLGIAFLQDMNTAMSMGFDADGRMTWFQSVSWIAHLNATSHLGYSDWELAGGDGGDGTLPLRTRANYLERVFYGTLGNARPAGSGSPFNAGPFVNFGTALEGGYWVFPTLLYDDPGSCCYAGSYRVLADRYDGDPASYKVLRDRDTTRRQCAGTGDGSVHGYGSRRLGVAEAALAPAPIARVLKLMTETPFYFPNGQRSLFGIFHAPGTSIAQSAFVFCHPFGEEKLWTHRVFVSFARQLAADGHPVLRFDYTGNGDSDGSFSETSVRTAIADVDAAVSHMRTVRGVTQINLLGLRFGATVAALAAEELSAIDRLVLWAPIVDGSRVHAGTPPHQPDHANGDLQRNPPRSRRARGRAPPRTDGQRRRVRAGPSAVLRDIGGEAVDRPKAIADRASSRKSIDKRAPGAGPAAARRQLPKRTLTFPQEEPFWKEIATILRSGAESLLRHVGLAARGNSDRSARPEVA